MNTRSYQRAVMATPYKIVRVYETASRPRHTIATGLTLTEAQAHCHHPDNNSLTCRTEELIDLSHEGRQASDPAVRPVVRPLREGDEAARVLRRKM